MKLLSIAASLLISAGLAAQTPTLTLTQVGSGFTRVTTLANAGDDRLFVCEKAGIIKFFRPYQGNTSTTFMDINSRVFNISGDSDERGLLGLAFDPNYATNGRFYVNYINNSGNTVVARYTVTPGNPNAGDVNSEQILLTITQPYSNHNGGCTLFGPDGYLYIGMGDGGSGGDPQNFAQNPQSLLGKMLRIDVSTNDASYTIPSDNPFTSANDPNNSVRDEIWAQGLRNPWRWSFDRVNGDMWIADVGQNVYEEVNYQPASSNGGENYGWRCYEADATYNTSGCQGASNYVFPIFSYDHSNPNGCSITGGYVYRGSVYGDLYSRYFVTDYCSGRIWSLLNDGNGNFPVTDHGQFNTFSYTTFGEDAYGEVYVARQNGIIFRLTSTAAPRAAINTNGSLALCEGQTLALNTQFNPLLTYTWLRNGEVIADANSSSYNAAEAGSYSVRVSSAAGETESEAVVVTLNPSPTVSLSGVDPLYCTNSTILVNPTLEPAGGVLSGPGVSGVSFQPSSAGAGNHTLTYTYTDNNNCSASASFDVIVDECTQLESAELVAKVFPNPFQGQFVVQPASPALPVRVRVFNVAGQLIQDLQQAGGEQLMISMAGQPAGLYTVVIEQAGKQSVQQLVQE
jgi:glucose/arabinose dehydrogenase